MSTPFTRMLDTNTVSQLIRQPRGGVAQRLVLLEPHSVCLSVVVACELRFGARKKAQLQAKVEALLQSIPVLPLNRQPAGIPARARFGARKLASLGAPQPCAQRCTKRCTSGCITFFSVPMAQNCSSSSGLRPRQTTP